MLPGKLRETILSGQVMSVFKSAPVWPSTAMKIKSKCATSLLEYSSPRTTLEQLTMEVTDDKHRTFSGSYLV